MSIMYKQILKYSRRLQRRVSSSSDAASSSLNNNNNSSSSSNNNVGNSSNKPLLPETMNDITQNTAPPSTTQPLSISTSGSSTTSDNNNNNNTGESSSSATTVPTHAYFTLATAVIALSSIGPSLDLQLGVAPILKIYWRMTGTWMVLSIPAGLSIYKDGLPQLNQTQVMTFLSASFCYAVMCVGFVMSLEYTSVGNAVIFSNTHALLLLLGRFLIGSSVTISEGAGALLAFLGGVFCTYDASVVDEDTPTELQPGASTVAEDMDIDPIWIGFWGDLIATTSALGGVLYLVLASSVRARFPSVYVYVFMNMVTASIITLSTMILMGEKIELSTDINIGLLGFMNSRYDRLPLEMFMVVVCNLTGSMGYLKSTQYFDNLVISVSTLLEPAVASTLAWAMGVGLLPGFLGCIGNLFVAVGTVMVINPRSQRKESNIH